ncbi:MAG: hypothetical protein WCG42_02025 [Parachlamydiaceae bacterium]
MSLKVDLDVPFLSAGEVRKEEPPPVVLSVIDQFSRLNEAAPHLLIKIKEKVPHILDFKDGGPRVRFKNVAEVVDRLFFKTIPVGKSVKESQEHFGCIVECIDDSEKKVVIFANKKWKNSGNCLVFKGGSFLSSGDYIPSIIRKVKVGESRSTEDGNMILLKNLRVRQILEDSGCGGYTEKPRMFSWADEPFTANQPLEVVQQRYLADFVSFVKNEEILSELDVSPSTSLKVPFLKKIESCIEFINSLQSFPIIHGDISPANIFIDENLRAKIHDFDYSGVPVRIDDLPESALNYPYWPQIMREYGFLTSFTDVYGTVMTVMETLVPVVSLGSACQSLGLRVDGLELMKKYIEKSRSVRGQGAYLLECNTIEDFEKALEATDAGKSAILQIKRIWITIKTVLGLVETIKIQERELETQVLKNWSDYILAMQEKTPEHERWKKNAEICKDLLSLGQIKEKLSALLEEVKQLREEQAQKFERQQQGLAFLHL